MHKTPLIRLSHNYFFPFCPSLCGVVSGLKLCWIFKLFTQTVESCEKVKQLKIAHQSIRCTYDLWIGESLKKNVYNGNDGTIAVSTMITVSIHRFGLGVFVWVCVFVRHYVHMNKLEKWLSTRESVQNQRVALFQSSHWKKKQPNRMSLRTRNVMDKMNNILHRISHSISYFHSSNMKVLFQCWAKHSQWLVFTSEFNARYFVKPQKTLG